MRSLAVLLLVACQPASQLVSPRLGTLTWDVDDPRCIPTRGDYAPTIRLVADGGLPDAGFLAWDQVEVRVEGLPPCRPLDMIFGQAVGGFAFAVFQADFDGTVSSAQAPLRGSWSGADIDGPVYSSEGGLFVQSINVLSDWGAPGYLEVNWPRRELSRGVDVLPVRGARGVFGDLYLPSTQAPWPVLIAIGGAEGGQRLSSEVARTFVEQGYLVLALSYWGLDGLPSNIDSVRLEYFLEAIEVVSEYPGARTDRIGLVGFSRGSEAALLVAAASPKVKAVVSVVGSGLSWPAFETWNAPSWTLSDAGVAFVPWSHVAPVTVASDDGGLELGWRESWAASLRQASSAAIEAATIPVERIGGPVLLLAANDDQFWPSCELSDVAWNRLVDAGHTQRHPLDAHACFAGAGHALNPGLVGLPLANSLTRPRPDGGIVDRYGGSVQANGRATREAWQRVSTFLEAALK